MFTLEESDKLEVLKSYVETSDCIWREVGIGKSVDNGFVINKVFDNWVVYFNSDDLKVEMGIFVNYRDAINDFITRIFNRDNIDKRISEYELLEKQREDEVLDILGDILRKNGVSELEFSLSGSPLNKGMVLTKSFDNSWQVAKVFMGSKQSIASFRDLYTAAHELIGKLVGPDAAIAEEEFLFRTETTRTKTKKEKSTVKTLNCSVK